MTSLNEFSCMSYDKDAETIDEFLTRFTIQSEDLLHKYRNNGRKMVSLLMRALSVPVFTAVQRELAPDSALDVSYDQIKDTLRKLYSKKKSVLGSSIQFFNCKQKSGQSVEEFARQVKYCSMQCGFEAQVKLSRIQRDVFLAGLNSTAVITTILQDSDDLTFDETVARAKAITQLRQDTSMLQQPVHNIEDKADVNVVKEAAVPHSYVCIRCLERGKHRAQDCYAINLKCRACLKTGHVAKACRSLPRGSKVHTNSKQQNENVRHCNSDNTDDSLGNTECYAITSQRASRKEQVHGVTSSAGGNVKTQALSKPECSDSEVNIDHFLF